MNASHTSVYRGYARTESAARPKAARALAFEAYSRTRTLPCKVHAAPGTWYSNVWVRLRAAGYTLEALRA